MIDFYLFKNALRDLLRIRRLLVIACLVAVPPLMALTIRMKSHVRGAEISDPVAVYNLLAPALVFGFIMVILAVVFCTGAITQELEQKTIVYLLIRPVPRWRILLPRFLASIIVVVAATSFSLIALATALVGPAHIGQTAVKHDILMTPVGALAYGALFLVLAAVVNRPLIWGLLYAFGVESWAPTLPGIQKLSLMAYFRVLAPHAGIEEESVELQRVLETFTPAAISNSRAWTVLILVVVLALFAALLLFSRREYVPREDAE